MEAYRASCLRRTIHASLSGAFAQHSISSSLSCSDCAWKTEMEIDWLLALFGFIGIVKQWDSQAHNCLAFHANRLFERGHKAQALRVTEIHSATQKSFVRLRPPEIQLRWFVKIDSALSKSGSSPAGSALNRAVGVPLMAPAMRVRSPHTSQTANDRSKSHRRFQFRQTSVTTAQH